MRCLVLCWIMSIERRPYDQINIVRRDNVMSSRNEGKLERDEEKEKMRKELIRSRQA